MRQGQAEERPPFLYFDIVITTAVGVTSFIVFTVSGLSAALAAAPMIAGATASFALSTVVWAGMLWRRDRRQKRQIREERKVRQERQMREKERNREKRNLFRDRLLADVSHEIRTPLTGILGFAAVLEEEVPPSQRELVRLIRHNGDRLLETVNSILEMARLEAGEQVVNLETFDVLTEVSATTKLFETHIEAQGLSFELQAPSEGTLLVKLDPKLFHRVLSNLMSNALKYTSKGSICVGVEHQGSALRVWVRDTGIGISEEFLPRLFEPYTREAEAHLGDRPGSGLGLAITRRLVEMMSGRLEVSSVKDEGSTFSAIFPEAVVPGDDPGGGAGVSEPIQTYSLDYRHGW